MKRLRVAIDGRVHPRTWGGVAHAAMGLIHSLGKLDGEEEYLIVVDADEQEEWLSRYLGPNTKFVRMPAPAKKAAAPPTFRRRAEKFVRRTVRRVAPGFAPTVQPAAPRPPRPPEIPLSDGYFEGLGCELIHFTSQRYVVCGLPSVYNPHDLQHLHFPEFFTSEEIARREMVYPLGCRLSQTVVVGTQWIKEDVVRQYAISPDKVQIIPWAPPSLSYGEPDPGDVARVAEKYQLPQGFAFYPAVPWPHKNHGRLLSALAQLRDRQGITVPLVCTGAHNQKFWADFWPALEAQLKELRLEKQVQFLGFVPEEDMRALFRSSRFLVLPSLFEADSCPIHEAWVEGVPVASSNAAALPDQVLDAGLLFDPLSVDDIASCVSRLATDAALREELGRRGKKRSRDFDWIRTAKAFRAVYRRVARRSLNAEDTFLLSWDWMREPDRRPPA